MYDINSVEKESEVFNDSIYRVLHSLKVSSLAIESLHRLLSVTGMSGDSFGLLWFEKCIKNIGQYYFSKIFLYTERVFHTKYETPKYLRSLLRSIYGRYFFDDVYCSFYMSSTDFP